MNHRQKAIEVTEETKKRVLDRQKYLSISGASLTVRSVEYHHVVPRSKSGVGYEWNIVAITSEEHRLYHDHLPIKIYGRERYTWEEFDTLMKNHLKSRYPKWTEKGCRYQKHFEEKDYGIEREKI